MAAPMTKENGIRDDTLAPYSDTFAPDSDPLAPDSGTLAPDSDTLTPDSDTLAPDSGTLAPDPDTLAPDSLPRHLCLSGVRFLLPLHTSRYVYYREIKTLQTLHKTLHSICISLIIRVLHCVGFEAKILHKPCTEPYMGTKSQRD